VVGEPLKKNVLEPPEPKGKLDAETVNGPEDQTLDWDTIVWPVHEENVRRLRHRIFKATKEQDLATVRNLQRMMLRSWSNTLISVRQVTQRNAGRGTPGGGRAGRADRPGQDGPGRAGAPHSTVLPAPAGPPSVHT
jgi:RNA-directed DNA polymerase